MIVGITGGIGSGKSMVCKCLRNMGYLVYKQDAGRKEVQFKKKMDKWDVLMSYYGRI